MSVNPVKGKFFRLLNGEALRARNAADDGDIEILKVGGSGPDQDKVILSEIPKIVNLTIDSNLSTESYVDSEISSVNDRIDDHVQGLAEKHNADDIVVAAGITNLVATDVQGALSELQGDINTINSTLGGLSFSAENISFAPIGAIEAEDVQAAIEELDTEKVAKAGDTMSGTLEFDDTLGATGQIDPFGVIGDAQVGDGGYDKFTMNSSKVEFEIQSSDGNGNLGPLKYSKFDHDRIQIINPQLQPLPVAGTQGLVIVQDSSLTDALKMTADLSGVKFNRYISSSLEYDSSYGPNGLSVSNANGFNVSTSNEISVHDYSSDNKMLVSSGQIKLKNNTTNLPTLPVADEDVAVKKYVDDESALKVAKAGDTMSGALTIDQSLGVTSVIQANDILMSDALGEVITQITHGDGLIASFTDGVSIAQSGSYSQGFLEVVSTSLDQSTEDGQLTVDATQGIIYGKTDYVNQFVATASINPSALVLDFNDQTSGWTSNTSYQHNVVNVQVSDGSGIATFNATAGSPVSNIGFDGLAPAPTLDTHLTSKKYVDDQFTAVEDAVSDHINNPTGAHAASAISFSNSYLNSNISAIEVQAAIQELDVEKVSKSGDTMTGTLIINPASGNAAELLDLNIGIPSWGPNYIAVAMEDGSPKQFYAGSGDQLGAFAGTASKKVLIASGFSSGAASGIVQVASGDAQVSGNSGGVDVFSGNAVGGISGAARLLSGAGSSNSGAAVVASGAAQTTGAVQIQSGNASAGNSGHIFLYTGTATGTKGSILINTEMNFQNAGKITNLQNAVSAQDAVAKSQLDAGLALKLDLAGGTMSGNIAMGSNSITNLVMTSDAHSAATKEYVDNLAEGLHVHAPARAIAVVDIGSANFSAGIIDLSSTPVDLIDGVGSWVVGQRVILANQENDEFSEQNGIYEVSAVSAGEITELSRAADFNSPQEAAGGDFIFVQEGTQYADTGWVQTETVATIDVSPIRFLQFSGAGSYQAGDGLDLDGTVFSVNVSEIAGSGLVHDGSNNLKLTDTGVTAAIYGTTAAKTASFTVDAQGRLSAASEQDISILSTQVSDFQSAVRNELSVGDTSSIDMSYSSGQFSADLVLDPVNSALAVGISGLSLQNTAVTAAPYGLTAAKAVSFTVDAQGRLTSASEQDISIVSTQVSDFQSAVRNELSSGDGLDYDSATGVFSVDLKSAGGLKIDATELAVEPADFAGDGLEDDGSDNLKIKLDGSSLSVSASGIKSNIIWHKQAIDLLAADITNGYVDLAYLAEDKSIVAFVDRLAIHEGASTGDSLNDYWVETVGGVTRVRFMNALTSPGPQALAATDNLFFTYQRKAS